MKDSVYLFTSDVLEFPCAISTFYVAGGASFIFVLHVWYGVTRVVHHDVRIFVLEEVPHIIIEQTILGNIECWPLWAVEEKSFHY